MKAKTAEMISRVQNLLMDNEYQSSRSIAERCHLKPTSVFRMIRIMRLSGIGVLTTNKGYVLSEYAKKTDDVNYLRRLYGRRNSDYIGLKAAEKDIQKRWNSISERQQLRLIFKPLSVDIGNTQGMKVLLTKSKKLGV